MKLRQPLKVIHDEKGMVLVVAMMLVAVLALLGTTSILTTNADIKISSNYRVGTQAFYIADAGIEAARNQLRTNSATYTLSQLLAVAGGSGGLSNSNNILNFYANGAIVSDDVPYVAQTTFGGGTYRVYLTNDVADGVTSATDTNNKVTITAIGLGPDNSLAILQEVVLKSTVPPLPGAIVLPGPNVIFNGGNSNASAVEGATESAISTTSAAAEAAVEANLVTIDRLDNYHCDPGLEGAPCINNEPANFNPAWTSVPEIETLAATCRSIANTVITSPSGVSTTLTAAQVGTTASRKIVFVDGAATINSVNGAGILVVTGQLTLSGNFNYNGLIMCIGEGSLLRNGGGNGEISGGIFVAKTRDSAGAFLSTLGIPTFDTNGGGNTDINYDAGALANAVPPIFVKRAWRQI